MQPSPLSTLFPDAGASRAATSATTSRRDPAANPGGGFADVFSQVRRPAESAAREERTLDRADTVPAPERANRNPSGRAEEPVPRGRTEAPERPRTANEEESTLEDRDRTVEEEIASAAAVAAPPAVDSSAPTATGGEAGAHARAPLAETAVPPLVPSGRAPVEAAELPVDPAPPTAIFDVAAATAGAELPVDASVGTPAAESHVPDKGSGSSAPSIEVPSAPLPVPPAGAAEAPAPEGSGLPAPVVPAEASHPTVAHAAPPAVEPIPTMDEVAPPGAAPPPPNGSLPPAVAVDAAAPVVAADSAGAGDGSRAGTTASGQGETQAIAGGAPADRVRGSDFAETLRRADPSSPTSRAERIETIERIVAATRLTLNRGETRLRMLLHPPQLGGLRVDLSVKDGVLDASLSAETHAARHVLAANLDSLRDSLVEQGIAVHRLEVSVWDGFSRDAHGSHSSRDESGRDGAGPGSGRAQEMEPESLAAIRRRLALLEQRRVDVMV